MPLQLCCLEDIGDRGKDLAVTIDGRRQFLMLFRHLGQVKAYRNMCPHQGRSLNFAPDRFILTPEGQVVCAHHGATFELSTGLCIQGPCAGASLSAVPIEVDGSEVVLRLE